MSKMYEWNEDEFIEAIADSLGSAEACEDAGDSGADERKRARYMADYADGMFGQGWEHWYRLGHKRLIARED